MSTDILRFRPSHTASRAVIPENTRVIVFGDDLGNVFPTPRRGRVRCFVPGDGLGPPSYYGVVCGRSESWVPPYQLAREGGYRVGDRVKLLYDLEPVGGGVLMFVWSEHVGRVIGLLPDGGIVVDPRNGNPQVVVTPSALRHASWWRSVWYGLFGR